MDIKTKPVKTRNENGDRFILTIDEEDNSVTIYDNHKRDGYCLYSGDGKTEIFGNGKHINEANFQYYVDKMNELYMENQALKNNNEYHQIVMDKLDKAIEEYEFFYITSLKRYNETKKEKDKLLHMAYGWTLTDLQCIQDDLQGDEYE